MDELATHRPALGLGESASSENPGGPAEIVEHDHGHQSRTAGIEMIGGHIRRGAVLQIRVDLLDHRMLTVGLVRRRGAQGPGIRGVEERVEAVFGKQCSLAGRCLGIQLRHSVHHQTPGNPLVARSVSW